MQSTPSLLLHLGLILLIAALSASQDRALRKRGVPFRVRGLAIVFAAAAIVGEALLALNWRIGAVGIVAWLACLVFGTALVDRTSLPSRRWRLLLAFRELQHQRSSLVALQSAGLESLSGAEGGQNAPKEVDATESRATSVDAELSERAAVLRARMADILERMDAMRDESTANLIDLVQESYGHAIRADAPTPERASQLHEGMVREASVLFPVQTDADRN